MLAPPPSPTAAHQMMNNCAVKMALSGVFGGLMGAVFGIAMGGFDGAVRLWRE